MSDLGLNLDEKTAVMIDGQNLLSSLKGLGIEIDYQKMRNYFREETQLKRMYFYAIIRESTEDNGHVFIRPLLDFLDYNGYTVITKPTKEFVDSETGYRKIKGSINVEMAVDMMKMAPTIDHLVLFSGDGEFRAPIAAIQEMGVRTTCISTSTMIADELRRQTDDYVDIASIIEIIGRDNMKARSKIKQA